MATPKSATMSSSNLCDSHILHLVFSRSPKIVDKVYHREKLVQFDNPFSFLRYESQWQRTTQVLIKFQNCIKTVQHITDS